ncbi:MAG: S8 family serine peptidase [candidate division Zixibacteria bacterium]|nr:S8 family serine peptidase [candidate division Zixibacteria bacterium]
MTTVTARLIVALITITILVAAPASRAGMMGPSLAELVDQCASDGTDSLVTVVVFLENNTASELGRAASRQYSNRAERIRETLARLQSVRPEFAGTVESFLTENSTTEIQRRWIVPAYTATILVSKVSSLVSMNGVDRVVTNVRLSYDPPVEQSPAGGDGSLVSSEVSSLGVPSLWQRGITGSGRLICSFDTGVESTHPALSSKWRGNHQPLSATWFSKVAPAIPPTDKTGHGTHTMGVMLGSTSTDSIGVAPGAEWISAGVIDQGRSLSVTLNDILEAFEWALNPDGDVNSTDDVPDVILNSWGLPKGLFVPCDDMFSQVLANVEAAGIVTVFAAGNEGPDPMTLRHPADLATTPVNTFAVGAVNSELVVADFSSRGPSSCDQVEIKPELVAPGVSIRSSFKGGGYSYMTGTSMAAPYIAGAVALIRQYNPNATVEQIKMAILQSCIDLGAPGEDNTYGHGYPDFSRVLDYIPPPVDPAMNVASLQILGGSTAFPGDTFQLSVTLTNAGGQVDQVGAILVSRTAGVDVLSSVATYNFGFNGITAGNDVPFVLNFDQSLYNGMMGQLDLELTYSNGTPFDTVQFSLTVGIAPAGTIATHDNGTISLAVSDFGQCGFAPGSIYNVNQTGLRFAGSDNLLYEAGLVVGRNSLLISGAVRDSAGNFAVSDFTPTEALSTGSFASDDSYTLEATLSDFYSQIPIPITVSQQTTTFSAPGDESFVLFSYQVMNESIERLTNLYFGFLADFDLPGGSENTALDLSSQLIYSHNASDPMVGLVALENIDVFQSLENGINKTGIDRVLLYEMISSDSNSVDQATSGDMISVISGGPFALNPGESATLAFAIIAGHDVSELMESAERAKARYGNSTDVQVAQEALPKDFVLNQNYPNPFNPHTTISFALEARQDVTLEIINILGQRVRTLVSGVLPPGAHAVKWNGADDAGHTAASGVYFYRLSTQHQSTTRKMTLLK